MNVVVLDWKTVSSGDLDARVFEEFGNVTVYPMTAPHELLDRVADADVVLCNKVQMTAEAMAAAPRLRYIGLFATGYNNVDLVAAKQHGITVCNAGGYCAEAVAQHAFAMILELANRIADYNALVQDDGWIQSDIFSRFQYPTTELFGKTLGVVGYGSIAQSVIRMAKGFGMTVLCHTRTKREAEGVRFVSLDELLDGSDIVTVHCPLNAQTERMFDARAFANMRDGAWFINTARGPIVDEQALRDALVSGKLGGAAVDVLDTEPMAADCVLKGINNCLITPHVAWAPRITRERLVDLVCENLRSFVNETPQNVIV